MAHLRYLRFTEIASRDRMEKGTWEGSREHGESITGSEEEIKEGTKEGPLIDPLLGPLLVLRL